MASGSILAVGGYELVESGAVAQATTVKGGTEYVLSSGTADGR